MLRSEDAAPATGVAAGAAVRPPAGRLTRLASRQVAAAAAASWAAFALLACRAARYDLRLPLDARMRDLHVYYGAMHAIWRGDLYGFRADNGYPFTYPPPAGLLLSPIRMLSEQTLRQVWTAATLLVLVPFAILVARSARVRFALPRTGSAPLSLQPIVAPVLAILLLRSAPSLSNLHFGQISFFLVALVLLDCLDVVPARFSGIATGLAAAIKLTPMIFVPYLWLSGRRRAACGALAAFTAATALAAAVLPKETLKYWTTEVWQTDRVGKGKLDYVGNESLHGVLLRSGAHGRLESACWVLGALIILVLGIRRAVQASKAGDPLLGAAIAGAVGLAVSPVSWTHHQWWVLLAVFGTAAWRTKTNAVWAVAVLGIMTFYASFLDRFGGFGSFLDTNLRGLLTIALCCCLPVVGRRGSNQYS